MAKFFIDRPIFAWVLAIIVMLAGVLAIRGLPVAQYPTIAPPTVRISATYPGASAATVESSVTQIVEQNMQGLDGLQYMSSTSDSTGSATTTLTFTSNTNPDTAQVQVQNKLQAAMASLPQVVQQFGVRVDKSTSGFLMVAGFVSADGSMSGPDLSDFLVSRVQDPISRVSGVGSLQVFGSQYAMRIWLDPTKLQQYSLTPTDVANALQVQNAQVSAGQLGGLPSVAGQQLNATITVQSRLSTPEQFSGIFLRTLSDGSSIYIRDVGRVEIGAENYNTIARYNRKPAAGFAVSLANNANALDTAQAVRDEIERLKPTFPQGIQVVYPYDTTPFVKISIEEVIKTLIEAIVLVFAVMLLFLQSFRATLVPTLAVPVVLLGTFAVLYGLGYSINTLTMFAMVLAIGLLVDDAIVVVENVERIIHDEGLSPRDATRKSMDEITGALVGIAVVLSAVFVPMAFFGGSVGVIYRQFSVTIVAAMALSVLTAIIFSPALAAMLLKPGSGLATKGVMGWFNRSFDATNHGYLRTIAALLRRPLIAFVLYLGIVAGLVYLFVRLPTSFLPEEDQGTLFTQAQLPAGAAVERTQDVLTAVENYYLDQEKESVDSIFTVAGFSFSGAGQNMGFAFIKLKDFKERKNPQQKAQAVAGRAMRTFFALRDAFVFALAPPAVPGLGQSNGFDMYLSDQTGQGHEALMAARNQLLGAAAANSKLVGVRHNGMGDTPQFQIDVDQAKAGALGVPLATINSTLQTALAGTYVNDFNDRGRVKRVYVQGDAPFRMVPADVNRWYARNNDGGMVPLSVVTSTRWTYGSPRLERYNGFGAVNIQGAAGPGISSGQAMLEMEELAKQLPPGFALQWTGLSYQERLSGSQTPLLYSLSMLIVFLALAALYESWKVPFSVLMAVPIGVAGALVAATYTGQLNDVYFQIGLLTTIGLAAKNAILIIEFAKARVDLGGNPMRAALIASKLRFRPIVMTSLAFILGVLPLAISTGAGAGAQNAIGRGVIGGMLAATLIGVAYVPLFYLWIQGRKTKAPVHLGRENPHGDI